MAKTRKPKTLLELNVLLAAALEMTPEERAAGKRLPLIRQGKLMVRAMPRATRVAEFVAMWAIAKAQTGATSVEGVSTFWDEPGRTIYRRLEEFREVWAPTGYETPDHLADLLIADYKRGKARLDPRELGRLLSAGLDVNVPALLG